MRTVTPLDLRRRLGRILDEASAGERFLIERDHRPLAYLVSVEDGRRLDPDPEEVRRRRLAALDRLEAFGERFAREHPGGPSAVEAIRAERARDDPGAPDA
jgi:antitoxin (DNA-binding transcriptional repressor) of toxin-antitoxin stability system